MDEALDARCVNLSMPITHLGFGGLEPGASVEAQLHTTPATLREWRREFARHLRDQGIAANATERAVRGESRKAKKDAIYRAGLRGDSSHVRNRVESVASEVRTDCLQIEPGRPKLMDTRKEVERGWRATSDSLLAQGHLELAARVRQFLDRMPPAATQTPPPVGRSNSST